MSSNPIENTEQVRELERAILGGLMLETERYDAVSEIIEFSDFEGQDHQNIFQSMGELVNSNKPLDPLTVSDRLDSKKSTYKSWRKELSYRSCFFDSICCKFRGVCWND